MQTPPTYDDVNLILKLYELRREEKLREARAFMGKYKASTPEEHLKLCSPGSPEDANFRMTVSYWDMAASFVTSGVLNQELFLQSGQELLYVWEKVRDIVPAYRQLSKNPMMWEHIERVANAAIERMNKANPEAYPEFSKRVRGAAA
jgi:hypothetical protein